MPFPTRVEYNTALLNSHISFRWPRIRYSLPERFADGYIYAQGSFALVAKLNIAGNFWALRLPLALQSGADERYRHIASEVGDGNPLFVPVEYFANALEVPVKSGLMQPAVLMKWVTGKTVSEYVYDCCRDSSTLLLKELRDQFVAIATVMDAKQMSHGDLSPDNIIVVQDDNEIRLQLIDYDSVWMPEIHDLPTSVGRTKLQHPNRPIQNDRSTDAFTLLVYYAVLTSLIKNPKIGAVQTRYEQKFVVDTDMLRAGLSNQTVRALHAAAPTEIGELLTAFHRPYSDTPSIVPAQDFQPHTDPISLSSDWFNLLKHAGKTVEVVGFVKRLSDAGGLVLTLPSQSNRSTSVVLIAKQNSKFRAELGDFVRAHGVVHLSDKTITVVYESIEVNNELGRQGYGLSDSTGIFDRIRAAAKRVRDPLSKPF